MSRWGKDAQAVLDHTARDGNRTPCLAREAEQKLFAKTSQKDTPAKRTLLPPKPAPDVPAEEKLDPNWHEDPVESSMCNAVSTPAILASDHEPSNAGTEDPKPTLRESSYLL